MNRIQALQAEESRLRSAMQTIENAAVEREGDLTEDEETELGHLRSSYDACAANIAEAGERIASQQATAEILQRIEVAQPSAPRVRVTSEPPPAITPGEYVSLYLRSVLATSATERDEATALLQRAAPAETGTADTPGVLPVEIVGDLVKFVDAQRPVIGSMRSLPMPAKGKTFTRPRLVQRTLVDIVAEKTALPTRQLTTSGDTVTKATHGGILNLTEQDIDWTDPAMLEVAIQDLAESYAISTEETACAAIVAAATTEAPFTIGTATAADLTPALAAGAASVYDTSKKLPDTVYAAVNVWAFLAGLTDGQDRPLFPTLSPVNASGTMDATSFAGNPMGLRLVVSPHFADDFLAIAATSLLEQYEQNKGLLQVPVPSVLEVQVAYRGYFATNIYPEGLCLLTAP